MRALELQKLLKVYFCQIPPSLYRLKSTAVLMHEARGNEHSTIDQDQVAFYNNLADKWWNTQGELKALHSLNKLRVQFVRDGLVNTGKVDFKNCNGPQPLEGIKILEVGCGGGILCEPLARIGATVTGIDASQNMIETAKLHATKDHIVSDRVTYVCQSIEEHMNEYSDYYDAVVASEVLEHVTQKELFLTASASTIKPGGSFFITTLNRTFALWAFGIIFAEYIMGILPKGTHNVNDCIKPHEVQALLEKYGCSTKLVHGMLYNFLNNEWHWSSITAINYALHAVRREEQC